MLYYLYAYGDINIFRYLTFRAGIAFFVAFLLCAWAMPRFISWAKARKANQPISAFVPAHQAKTNTPTMGGSVFLLAATISSLLCIQLHNLYALLGVGVLLLFGSIGARDDYTKITKRSNEGLSALSKLALLFLAALLISLLLYYGIGLTTDFYIPFVKSPIILLSDYPMMMISFWILVFLATSNAVNITDGLDGLACVPSVFAIATLCVFVYLAGNVEFGRYLFLPVVQAGELMIVGVALVGALLGFLWYNCHPAQVFMGDSGSLSLGGFMAYMAIVSNNEVLLLLIGLIFVIETLSVMLQIGSYKMRKKRVFLMAPIHHHFEQKGWAENKIIVRFWIIALLSNLIALLSLKVR